MHGPMNIKITWYHKIPDTLDTVWHNTML